MSKLTMAMAITVITNIFVWFQMNGQFLKNAPAWISSKLFVFAMGAPLGVAFWYGTKWYYEYFGNYWYVRPIGFGIGTLTFGLLTWILLNEVPDTRTIISLILSVIIIIIQLSHVIVK